VDPRGTADGTAVVPGAVEQMFWSGREETNLHDRPNVPVRLPLEIALTGVEHWIGGVTV
jgi:hypothetical protein